MKITRELDRLFSLAAPAGFITEVLTRVGVGLVFVQSGLGKLNHLSRTTDFFASIGVPAPGLQAPLVGGIELICGILLVIGLYARLATLPLIAVMAVALVTAKRGDLTGVTAIFEIYEFLYILLFLWIFARSTGALSVESLLNKRKR
jgi:putative oxidoreductase